MASRRRCNRKRCAILWALATFALIQVGFSVLIETRMISVRDPEYTFRETRWRERLADHPNQTRIVFLGSSRIACGIDAERITNRLNGEGVAFNFGIPRSGPFSQQVYLERLKEADALPDVLFIEVMVPFLCGKDVPFEDRGLDGERFSLGELTNLPFEQNVRGAYRKWLFHRSLPSREYGAEIRQQCGLEHSSGFNRENAELDPYGWRASGLPPERLAEVKALAHRQYDEAYRTFSIHPQQAKRLDELIGRCFELGITPQLILMPEGSEFRNLVSAAAEAQLQAFLNDLQTKRGVRVIDARAWMNDSAFIDMHHLDGQAAMSFSERLANQICSVRSASR